MLWVEYAAWVKGMHAQFASLGMHRINAGLGLAGEAGEIANLVKKGVLYGMGFDHKDMVEEIGDAFFYMTWLMETFDIDLHQVMEFNMEKLNKRYPDGWVPGGGRR